jgi:hypothetical protein
MPDSLQPPDPPPDSRRIVLAFIALLCVFISQIFLYVLPEEAATTAMYIFWLAIGGIVLFLASQFLHFPVKVGRRLPAWTVPSRILRVAAGFILSALATLGMVLLERYGRTNYIPVVSLWLGGALCYASAFLPERFSAPDARTWLKNHWKELAGIGLVTILAAVLRFTDLGNKPFVLNGDEGWLGIIALSTKSNPLANPFSLWENFGGIYLQTINWVFSWLGPTSFALRLLPAISGTLAIPAVYLLGRQITNHRVAWVAAFLLAISHAHLNFSRTAAVGYIHDTWIVPLVLFLLLSGLKRRSSLRTAFAGLLLGLQFSIYLSAQIFIPIILLFFLLLLLFFRKQFPALWKNLLAMAGGLLVVILPNLFYSAIHPEEFFNRLNVSGTFQSGWLAQQMAETGQSAIQILLDRFLHAFFSLIFYPAIDFYNSPIPLVSIITASLFLLGLGIALWKTRSVEFLLMNLYFWGATAAIGIFAIPASADSYRMIVTLPAVMLFAAIGLNQILSGLGLDWHRMRLGYGLVTGFVLVNLLFFNVWEYRVDFATQCRYGGDRQTRFASYMGTFLHTLRRETTIYLLSDDIYRFGTHASADFLGLGKKVTNIPDPIDTLTLIPGDVVIASPGRTDELDAWERAHPGGELIHYFDCDFEIMASYQVP